MLLVTLHEHFTCRDKRTRKILLLAPGSFEIALTAAQVHDLSWRKLVHSLSHGASLYKAHSDILILNLSNKELASFSVMRGVRVGSPR